MMSWTPCALERARLWVYKTANQWGERAETQNTMSTNKNLVRIQAATQKYSWGRQGSSSLAAQLAYNAIGHDFKIDENESYAEVRDLC